MQKAISGYHEKFIPFIKQKQINIGIIGAQNQGKSEIVFKLIEQMIDIKKNLDCHIFFFSTTLSSDVNQKRFLELQKQLKCYLYVYEQIPDKNQTEMRDWLMKHIRKENNQETIIKTLRTNKPVEITEIDLFYTIPNQPKIIIVLDDIFIDLIKIEKLMTVCRHINTNFIISTHSWINLSPSIKQYIDLFLVRNINPKYYKDIHANFIQNSMDIKTFIKLINQLNEQPFIFLYFACHHENYGFFKTQLGFQQINQKQTLPQISVEQLKREINSIL